MNRGGNKRPGTVWKKVPAKNWYENVTREQLLRIREEMDNLPPCSGLEDLSLEPLTRTRWQAMRDQLGRYMEKEQKAVKPADWFLKHEMKDLFKLDDSTLDKKEDKRVVQDPDNVVNIASYRDQGSLWWLRTLIEGHVDSRMCDALLIRVLQVLLAHANDPGSRLSALLSEGVPAPVATRASEESPMLLSQFECFRKTLKPSGKANMSATMTATAPVFVPGRIVSSDVKELERSEIKIKRQITKGSRQNLMVEELTPKALLLELGLITPPDRVPSPLERTPVITKSGLVDDTTETRKLPAGWELVKDNSDAREVQCPSRDTFKYNEAELLRVRDVLPDWGQEVFKGIKRLNFIQTQVFDAAYGSSDNLLVAAPTGSGKTNVALLTIARCLGAEIDNCGKIPDSRHFKIVYIAPLKSLVSEICQKYSDRLSCVGVKVAEFTGDMPLTRAELGQIHLIVTVPEKWDILTRNAVGGTAADNDSVMSHLSLLIIDEVHLLGESRGPVLEAILARSFTYMDAMQTRHRIVALSATLPNWRDVATFLAVPEKNIFMFDDRFRPIPLQQTVIGIKGRNRVKQSTAMVNETYLKIRNVLKEGLQSMVFVHSRGDTFVTAEQIINLAQTRQDLQKLFVNSSRTSGQAGLKLLKKCSHERLSTLMCNGVAVHHAGIGRHDRKLVEQLFLEGTIRVLVCTATLAWGVNLPARQVIIKGTNVFDLSKGDFTDLNILDVLQIFGRAGRPQFDNQGNAVLITTHDKMDYYIQRLCNQLPLESHLLDAMADHLNAEIVIGNVTDLESAANWLRSTFAFVRMRRNPQAYNLSLKQLEKDPMLWGPRKALVQAAAKQLHDAHLIRVTKSTMSFAATSLGRIAAKFYVSYGTVALFDDCLSSTSVKRLNETDIILTVANAQEFQQLKVRDGEEIDLERLNGPNGVRYRIPGSQVQEVPGKVALLMQAYLDRVILSNFSLVSDTAFIVQSFGRLLRAFSEIAFAKSVNISGVASTLFKLSRVCQRRIWEDQSPLRHFCEASSKMWGASHVESSSSGQAALKLSLVQKLEGTLRQRVNHEEMMNMSVEDIGRITRVPGEAYRLYHYLRKIPRLELRANVQPVTHTILKITVYVLPTFEWSDRFSGKAEPFKLWLEDPVNQTILHQEDFILKKSSVQEVPKCLIPGLTTRVHGSNLLDLEKEKREHEVMLSFAVPLREPRPAQYSLSIVSERWVGVSAHYEFALSHLLLPMQVSAHTALLPLNPIPIRALKNSKLEALYPYKFFNPVQSQTFHTLYHTDHNALVGAPTGSGKTVCAEQAIFRLFQVNPKQKVIYIAPLKALAKERLDDWTWRLSSINRSVVELSGDFTPDVEALKKADLIITTPEKWDGISRHWQHRSYVQQVGLMVIDEIHLLGQDRGPILEVIVSRMRYISAVCDTPIRFVGLSTALANATDIADWLGIGKVGLFNFKPAVRPVPCTVYVNGFAEKVYCPRMGMMNKPAFQQILSFSPDKPVLVFVSSRRQTRITAQELVMLAKTYTGTQGTNGIDFLHLPKGMTNQQYEEKVLSEIADPDARETLRFGVGMHNAGLIRSDRKLAEKLFEEGVIQVLVATSTLAWGVNLPARLVILKGTEYYDGATRRYLDMPVTDVLQMIGRAGRPQFDNEAVACIFIHEPKKQFYRRFLYEPFPVESALPAHFTNHLNAEIVSGSITNKRQAIDFLTWTYFFRRLHANPSHYDPTIGMRQDFVALGRTHDVSPHEAWKSRKEEIAGFVNSLVTRTIQELLVSGCITTRIEDLPDNDDVDLINKQEDDPAQRQILQATRIGRIASLYYLRHDTAAMFATRLSKGDELGFVDALNIVCDTYEMFTVPVRHNEDVHNTHWAEALPLPLDLTRITTGCVKAAALFQMQLFQLTPPVKDYYIDAALALTNSIRLMQAFADVCVEVSSLSGCLSLVSLLQSLTQGTHPLRSPLYTLPHMTSKRHVAALTKLGCVVPAQVLYLKPGDVRRALSQAKMPAEMVSDLMEVCGRLPRVDPSIRLIERVEGDGVEFLPVADGCVNEKDCVTYEVPYSTSLTMEICLQVSYGFVNTPRQVRDTAIAYAPKYPKQRYVTWWCLLGDEDNDELIDFRRLSHQAALKGKFKRDSGRALTLKTSLNFKTPPAQLANSRAETLKLFICSDCYVGFDQEVSVVLRLV
eukprot:Blabericola_migrator_1__611@NODE_114_length_13851_cov_137_870429_g102_i0_p1_GENE_NODE_114_length_13851_cov_137_870429_g102_i0NODE_114_length_13851_cov_137_870429_g102_i0_p1_ORF_typecomplete_len2172_score419_16Sec63/PF02889_16/1_8e58Sec63/PF02889_16/2_6e55DEAD/PF00270_29/3_5e26DEAD/PF00270_29/1_9e03DEAD/PF00270_29/3_7e24Helicase_C/PF00271_31/5_8e13Helicase_C/PF00271_31/7_6e03Helicase_C/PF00271_31/1e14ResIII/PF04851_15/1e12ResIII/PF04851_15/2_3e12AAA_19/PF13245_6/1_2e05AAA_19/PF13245_6/0_00062AAA_